MIGEFACVMGRAARTGLIFESPNRKGLKCFEPGCFVAGIEAQDDIALGINHGLSGQPRSGSAVIDPTLAIASTRDDTLQLVEDALGLLFFARFRADAYVDHSDGRWINIAAAIDSGACVGVSICIDAGGRSKGRVGHTDRGDVFLLEEIRLAEISILLPPETIAGSPQTWVMPAGPAAIGRLFYEWRTFACPS